MNLGFRLNSIGIDLHLPLYVYLVQSVGSMTKLDAPLESLNVLLALELRPQLCTLPLQLFLLQLVRLLSLNHCAEVLFIVLGRLLEHGQPAD